MASLRFATDRQVKSVKPGRSLFDLSHSVKLSGRMGYLYPVLVEEMVPGDVFDLTAEAVVRFAPMVAPVLHEIVLKADWFFVPYRILEPSVKNNGNGATNWERFISGGVDNLDASVPPRINVNNPPEGGLLDHLGIPPGLVLTGNDQPIAYPLYAYNLIYNEYYRDPNLETIKALADQNLLTGNWDADYFTRALPFQQRGTAPALPVTGAVVFNSDPSVIVPPASAANLANMQSDIVTYQPDTVAKNALERIQVKKSSGVNTLADNYITATSVDIAALRQAVQLQRWLEMSARGGYRYTELLKAHFGVAPRDDRLARPEYIGGLRQAIQVSEVLQTSKTESGAPQGNLAGHGIMAGRSRIGKYHAQEFGVLMCLMMIAPKPAYQQGISRQWLRVSKYDYYWPEFANLSEQAIWNEEIFAVNTSGNTNSTTWGYQGRYDEMRSKRDRVAGAFRTSLNYWHAGRIFGSLPALSSTFGHVDPTTLTRIFAVPSADHLYVHWGNSIRAVRPLPEFPNPGSMDHVYGGR